MKLRKYILQLCVGLAAVGGFTSCEDMLSPESVYVIYDTDHLNSPSDTATSFIGIIYKMQAIGDRTNLLGEVRADLVSLRDDAHKDLQELASFTASDENKYNNPTDYYGVINNCNYYIAYADTTAKGTRDDTDNLFTKELAQVRTIRAWTYLQLVLNYGEVPFYTHPLLTEQAAQEVENDPSQRKDLLGVCNYFIPELEKLVNIPFPQLHTVGSVNMNSCYYPVEVVLADMYLWRASINKEQNDYKKAAEYYLRWLMLEDKNKGGKVRYNPISVQASTVQWSVTDDDFLDEEFELKEVMLSGSSTLDQTFTSLPMDSAACFGYFSELSELWGASLRSGSSNSGRPGMNGGASGSDEFSLMPSDYFKDLSASQNYCYVDDDNEVKEFEKVIENSTLDPRLYQGDLRLQSLYSSSVVDGDMYQRMAKLPTRSISIYTHMVIWLRLAEAMNNAGYPRFAYALLATGLSTEVMNDSVVACIDTINNKQELDFLNTLDKLYYTGTEGSRILFGNGVFKGARNGKSTSVTGEVNTKGIHSRGCGYAELDPEYAYPMADKEGYKALWDQEWKNKYPEILAVMSQREEYLQIEDAEKRDSTIQAVTADSTVIALNSLKAVWANDGNNKAVEMKAIDQMILNEMAFETCFEGYRFHDLMRHAMRYNDNTIIAKPISEREGMDNPDGTLYTTLMDKNNWYLSWKGKVGIKK